MKDEQYHYLQVIYWQIKDKLRDILLNQVELFLPEEDTDRITVYETDEPISIRDACYEMLELAWETNTEVRSVLNEKGNPIFLSTANCNTAKEMIHFANKKRKEFKKHPLHKHLFTIQKRLDKEMTSRYQKLLDNTWIDLSSSLEKLTNNKGNRADTLRFANQLRRINILTQTQRLDQKKIHLHISSDQQKYMEDHLNKDATSIRTFIQKISDRINRRAPINIPVGVNGNTRE